MTRDGDDPEVQAMGMAHRNTVEFAVGHGVAVHAEQLPDDPRRAVRLFTRVAPLFDVPQTQAYVPQGLVLDTRAGRRA